MLQRLRALELLVSDCSWQRWTAVPRCLTALELPPEGLLLRA